MWLFASIEPTSIRLASSTSCGAVRSATWPISFRYIRTGVVEGAAVLEVGGFDRHRGGVLVLLLIGADDDADRAEGLEDGLGGGWIELGKGDQDVGGVEATLLHAGEDQRLGTRHQLLVGVPAVVLLDPQCHSRAYHS